MGGGDGADEFGADAVEVFFEGAAVDYAAENGQRLFVFAVEVDDELLADGEEFVVKEADAADGEVADADDGGGFAWVSLQAAMLMRARMVTRAARRMLWPGSCF